MFRDIINVTLNDCFSQLHMNSDSVYVCVYPDGTELQSCCMEPGSTMRELICGESNITVHLYDDKLMFLV